MKKWLIDKLRDPVWQFVGALIGLVGVIIPIFLTVYSNSRNNPVIQSPEPGKLLIHKVDEDDLLDFPVGMQDRVSLLIDGKVEDSVKIHKFQLGNQTGQPILPTDFVEPLTLTVQDGRRVVAIRPNNEDPVNTGYTRFGGYYFPAEPIYANLVESEWTSVATDTFELQPLLLNPSEGVNIIVYTASITTSDELDMEDEVSEDNFGNDVESVQFAWNCRIINVQCDYVEEPIPLVFAEDETQNRFLSALLRIRINFIGWGVYLLALLVITLTSVTLALAVYSGRVGRLTRRQATIILIGLLLAVGVSEVIADWATQRGIMEQALFARVLLIIYGAFIVYLLLPIIKSLIINFISTDD